MKFNHVFIDILGQKFYDFVGYTNKTPDTYWTLRYVKSEDTIMMSYSIVNELKNNIDSFLDGSFVPNTGDEIHVMPDCPIPTQDIRNNYKLKRDFDSGVCNVFSPFKVETNSYTIWTLVAVPSKKKVFFTNDTYRSDAGAIIAAQAYIPEADGANTFIYRANNNNTPPKGPLSLDFSDKLANYTALLLKTNTKPCISYKKLQFNHGNELTVDVLQFVLQSGSKTQHEYDDAESKYLINVAMLNQHNWRDYPRTVSIVMHMVNDSYGVGREVYRHPNRYSKYVREIISTAKSYPSFGSEKDFEMLKTFFKTILNIEKDVMYVDNNQLQTKMMEHNINYANFCEVFNNITRITPKKYEAVESGDSVSASV